MKNLITININNHKNENIIETLMSSHYYHPILKNPINFIPKKLIKKITLYTLLQ